MISRSVCDCYPMWSERHPIKYFFHTLYDVKGQIDSFPFMPSYYEAVDDILKSPIIIYQGEYEEDLQAC